MKLKSLLIAATLLLSGSVSAAQFGFWESNVKHDAIESAALHADGTRSSIGIYLDGDVMISAYPAGWHIADSHYEERRWMSNILVNGQAVKFKFSRSKNGAIHAHVITYRGREYVRNEFWNKARVTLKTQSGDIGTFSAKGVQAAWQHLKFNRAI